MDEGMQFANNGIHIVASPVVYIAESSGIGFVSRTVGDTLPLDGIGVEIVIHMDCVYVVARHDIAYHHANPRLCVLFPGVEIPLIIVLKSTSFQNMCRALRQGVVLEREPIRIQPYMHLYSPRMRFVEHKLQRVIRHLSTPTARLSRQPKTHRLQL